MPDVQVGAQIFDLAFHPTRPIVYTALLTGEVKSFAYDEQGNHTYGFVFRPSKRSCRSIALDKDGSRLWAVGKSKAIFTIDCATGTLMDTRAGAHDAPINRVKHLTSWLFTTGDDQGVVKLWDPRTPTAVRSYTHHFDFISDFLWLEDKKQLVATSGDGTLSVIDVRSKKKEPLVQSEDQEDELLSILSIKGGAKTVVGTQLGILSIFNKSKGWLDCVDRVPGHPSSIDSLCSIPSSYPASDSTILTGSSDGLLRAVQLLPTKLVGVIASHGDFPIERIAVDMGGEGRWVGSVGHDEVLKMTDLKEVFKDDDDEGSENGDGEREEVEAVEEPEAGNVKEDSRSEEDEVVSAGEESADGSDSDAPKQKKRKRKERYAMPRAAKKGRNEPEVEPSFFSGL